MYVLQIVVYGAYAIIAPFVPGEFRSKGVSIKMIGVIFGSYTIGGIVSSLFVGKFADKTGPKFFLLWGMIVMTICLTMFGMLDLLTDPLTIALLALTLRFIEGLAAGSVATAIYTIAANDYPKEVDAILGNLEAC